MPPRSESRSNLASGASEDRLLGWLRRQLGGVERARIGDDAALLALGERGTRDWAITVDSQIEGVHVPVGVAPALLARRLLAVNLSDLAAVGAEPAFAFLALSAPAGFDHRTFFTAFVRRAREVGLTLAGGDLARQPERTTATLTLLGRRPKGGRWLERAAARAGDRLWLGGTVGESALGQRLLARGALTHALTRVVLPPALDLDRSPALARAARRAIRRHLEPVPQLELGRALGRLRRAAAIDLSDGLARDLHRLCRESGVGAEIDAASLPLADRFSELAERLGEDPLSLALGGGEDYVLLFALPPRSRPPADFVAVEIGRVTADRPVALIEGKRRRRLPPLGWDHLGAAGRD